MGRESGGVYLQGAVHSPSIVVLEVVRQRASPLAFVEHDDVVQALAETTFLPLEHSGRSNEV